MDGGKEWEYGKGVDGVGREGAREDHGTEDERAREGGSERGSGEAWEEGMER